MEYRLNDIEPRTASLMMVGATLLVMATLAVYVVWPEINAYRKSLRTLQVLERTVQNGEEVVQEMAALQQEVDGRVKRLHGDMLNMPKNQMEAFIIGRLQGISWRNKVELHAVTPGKGDTVQKFEEVLFDVEVFADYFDLFAWLQNLSEELGYVVVKRFSIGSDGRNDSDTRLTARFTIVSYREVGSE